MKCSRCQRENTLVLLFQQNIVYCLGCKPVLESSQPFQMEAGMHLHLQLLLQGCFWTVVYSRLNSTVRMTYVLKRNGVFFGNLVDYLGGVIYLDGGSDDEGLTELQKALYETCGVQHIQVSGRQLLTYIP